MGLQSYCTGLVKIITRSQSTKSKPNHISHVGADVVNEAFEN